MTGYKKSKTNKTYFQDIPDPNIKDKIRESIFILLKEKSDIRAKKSVLSEQQKDTRKTIYNMALRMEKIEQDIEDKILRGGF